MVVRGPTVSLRLAREADAEALLELGSDPEVTRWFSWGPYREIGEPLAYIDSLAGQRDSGQRLEFLIIGEAGAPIGVTGLADFAARDRRATVGTWLGRSHWGTGVNRESKALVLALAFRELGLERVSALASPENERSLGALERLGFLREGCLRHWQMHGGEPRDCVILGLLRDEWEASDLAGIEVAFEGRAPEQFYSQRK